MAVRVVRLPKIHTLLAIELTDLLEGKILLLDTDGLPIEDIEHPGNYLRRRPTAQELNCARQFLKDNGIDSEDIANEESPVATTQKALRDYGDEPLYIPERDDYVEEK